MDERAEADVILDVVFDRGLFFLVLENTGDRAAHGVRVKFGERFSGVGGAKRIDRLALFASSSSSSPRGSRSRSSSTAAPTTSRAASRHG